MSIDWNLIGQEHFDRIVEALINRRYPPPARVIAVNGRGGDGGIDIEVRQGNRLRIFQLKYFPEGFSGGFAKSRRDQITRSYNKMLPEKPYEWVLVVPNNLIPSERTFINALGGGSATPRRRVLDRKELDDLLIDFPEVDRWAQRNVTTELRENAKIFNREVDNLLGPADLGVRVDSLGKLVDSADLDWTFDFHRVGDTVVEVLRAQHPRAHIVSPVAINLRGQFGPQHEQLKQQLQRKVGFGTAETIQLPPETVDSVEVTGPEFVARQFESSTVVIGAAEPAPGVGQALELRFSDESGTAIASHEGCITHLGKGTRGLSLKAAFYEDRLTVDLTFPVSPDIPDIPTSAQISKSIAGARPRVVLDVLRLAGQFRAAWKVEAFIEGAFLMSLLIEPGNEIESDDIVFEEFATDLDVVQQHCQQYFAFPNSISPLERVELRVARILIDGGIVATPQAPAVTLTLNGQDSEELRATLAEPVVPVVVVHPNYTVTLGDRTLPIGPVWLFHPAAALADSTLAIAALDAGEAADFEIDYVPTNGPYFFAAMAELPQERIHNQPQTLWELHDITQPRQDPNAEENEQLPPQNSS